MREYQTLTELGSDPELIVSVERAGQGTFRAYLGDKAHGYLKIERLPSFEAAIDWIENAARRHYPHSQYVMQHPVTGS